MALKMKRLLVITAIGRSCGRLNICSRGSHTPPTLSNPTAPVGQQLFKSWLFHILNKGDR